MVSWILTPKGEELLRTAYDYYDDILDIVSHDIFLYSLMDDSIEELSE